MIIGTTLIVLIWVLFIGMGLPLWAGIVLTVLGAILILFGFLFFVYFNFILSVEIREFN